MPTRSRTKSASKDVQSRTKDKSTKSDDTLSEVEKENRARTARSRSKPQAKPANDARHIQNDTYCLCNQPDDGSPMVCCSECAEWYHFRCIKLSVEQAEDLEVYICPSCTESTGRRMIMQWEDPESHLDIINIVHDDDRSNVPPRSLPTPPPALSPSESEDEPDSEDEYVAEPDKEKGRRPFRRRTRHVAYTSDSDHSDTNTDPPAHKFSPLSEGRRQSPVLKRKSGASHSAREAKRKKSSDTPLSAEDDPARKYCLGKLREMFHPVFLRYPHRDDEFAHKVELKAEDLTDEDKQRLQNEADTFAMELEQCVFELYGESDKHGKHGVGAKYKERFRMLTFNLTQEDRVVIHKRICYAAISAKELSQMSSTDLANEETKESIKLAEKEALEHSILQKTLVPRAKITHKGLQDIEDLNGESATLLREREKEREKEEERREEERRERERQARLKAAEQHQRDRASSISQGSIPPESPIVPPSATWGGHFPVQHDSYSPAGDMRPLIHPLFVPASDLQTSPEPELDIADLIHLDDEPTSQDTFGDQVPTPALEAAIMPSGSDLPAPAPPEPAPPPPLTISPSFTSELSQVIASSPTQTTKPETPARASFDLNALWSSPKTEPASQELTKEPGTVSEQEQEHRSHPVGVDAIPREATDQDFDMFLEKDQDTDVARDEQPQDPEAVFLAAPLVWTGKVVMPVDTSIPQVAPVVARQVGGRSLGADSPLWRTLFPTDTLRIDGRVPIENSAHFLLQTRLNPQKELIACAFSPEGADGMLQTFSDFLLHKNRHGLVFPWGHQSKDYHPGKELYMVPLLASMPLPEFIELLDELRLPKIRQNNYVIGIWILVRGKLAPPPALPTTLPSLPQPQPQPSAPLPAPSLPAALQAYPQLANSALAAEVAALTPEQIQAILRTLSSGNGGIPGVSGGLATAVANVAHPPGLPHPHPHLPAPTTMPTAGPAHSQLHWPPGNVPMSMPPVPAPGSVPGVPGPGPSAYPGPPPPGAPSYMGANPLTPPQPSIPSPHGLQVPPSGPRAGGFPRYDRDDGSDGRYRDERGVGGWQQSPPNGRGRGRARARGRGGSSSDRSGSGDFVGRPVDAGWARHRAGPPSGPGQEERGRWDGPSPPRRWG